MYRRFISTVPQPTQFQVFLASHGQRTEVPLAHEVQRWHHGEDGEVLELHNLRGSIFIDDAPWGRVQEWYALEMMSAFYDQINEEN